MIQRVDFKEKREIGELPVMQMARRALNGGESNPENISPYFIPC